MLGEEVITVLSASLPRVPIIIHGMLPGYASGIYFYQLKAGPFQDVKKMIVIK